MLVSRGAEVWIATDGLWEAFFVSLHSAECEATPEAGQHDAGVGVGAETDIPTHPSNCKLQTASFPPPASLQERMPGLSPFSTAVQLNFHLQGPPVIPHRVEGASGLFSQTPVPISESLLSQIQLLLKGIILVEFPRLCQILEG